MIHGIDGTGVIGEPAAAESTQVVKTLEGSLPGAVAPVAGKPV
jgi:hypothetical protein